jgi:hypothetical protein
VITDNDLKEIKPNLPKCLASAEHVQSGLPIPKPARVQAFSPDDWEVFVEEWATSLKDSYMKVSPFGGSGDYGVDIAGFCTSDGFMKNWDNYQCKHYDHPLHPSDIWIEIGKIVYYSHIGKYTPPQKHYFVCPKGIGTTLEQLLNNSDELKRKTIENWEKYCQKKITETTEVILSGALKLFLDSFDFKIFSSKSLVDLINGHSRTIYHAVRFGGGLPPRPNPSAPPDAPVQQESRYIRQIFDAYSDHLGVTLADAIDLESHKNLKRDYDRQRVRFYHAESLRNFARDTVPQGTFETLQDEIYHGVVDVCEGTHVNGFNRMSATITQAAQVALSSNPLASSIQTQDRQGICHQLANDDRLTWVSNYE